MTINDYLLYHPSMTISATKSVTINEFHLRINLVDSKNWSFTVSECFQESTQPLAQLFNQLLGTPGGPAARSWQGNPGLRGSEHWHPGKGVRFLHGYHVKVIPPKLLRFIGEDDGI